MDTLCRTSESLYLTYTPGSWYGAVSVRSMENGSSCTILNTNLYSSNCSIIFKVTSEDGKIMLQSRDNLNGEFNRYLTRDINAVLLKEGKKWSSKFVVESGLTDEACPNQKL